MWTIEKAGGRRAGSGREREGRPPLFTPGSRSQLIPLVARSLFRSFSLTASLEQATTYIVGLSVLSRQAIKRYTTPGINTWRNGRYKHLTYACFVASAVLVASILASFGVGRQRIFIRLVENYILSSKSQHRVYC